MQFKKRKSTGLKRWHSCSRVYCSCSRPKSSTQYSHETLSTHSTLTPIPGNITNTHFGLCENLPALMCTYAQLEIPLNLNPKICKRKYVSWLMKHVDSHQVNTFMISMFRPIKQLGKTYSKMDYFLNSSYMVFCVCLNRISLCSPGGSLTQSSSLNSLSHPPICR